MVNWLSLSCRSHSPRTKQAPPRRDRFRPFLEHLEYRMAPAVFVVNTLDDISTAGGANPDGTITGTTGIVRLRSAIEAAHASPRGNVIDLTLPGTYRIRLAGADEDATQGNRGLPGDRRRRPVGGPGEHPRQGGLPG